VPVGREAARERHAVELVLLVHALVADVEDARSIRRDVVAK
jgi:hypothetical protein